MNAIGSLASYSRDAYDAPRCTHVCVDQTSAHWGAWRTRRAGPTAARMRV